MISPNRLSLGNKTNALIYNCNVLQTTFSTDLVYTVDDACQFLFPKHKYIVHQVKMREMRNYTGSVKQCGNGQVYQDFMIS